MDQHRRSLVLSQAPVRCPPDSLKDLILIEEPEQPWSLLLPISSSGWNSSSLLSMTQQRNETYPPTVDDRGNAVGTIMYNSLLNGHTPNHRPTRYLSDESSVAKTHQHSFIAPVARPYYLPRFDIDTAQSLDPLFAENQMLNESRAVADVVANSNDHGRSVAEEAHAQIMPFGAKPFSNDCSCSSTSFSASGSTGFCTATMPRKKNQVSWTHHDGEHPVSAPALPSQFNTPPDQGTTANEMAQRLYQCGLCSLVFSQRQGLNRHNKDKHTPKKPCSFCVEFTWPQGRRYLYRNHLQQKHPGFSSPSVSVTPITPRRGVKLKGRRSCENSFAHRKR